MISIIGNGFVGSAVAYLNKLNKLRDDATRPYQAILLKENV